MGRDLSIFLSVWGIENGFFGLFFNVCFVLEPWWSKTLLRDTRRLIWWERPFSYILYQFENITKNHFKNDPPFVFWKVVKKYFWNVVKTILWPKREGRDCRGQISGLITPVMIQFTAVPRLQGRAALPILKQKTKFVLYFFHIFIYVF